MMTRQEFFDLLENIKRRPGMYLGAKSVTRLQAFLEGMLCGLSYKEKNYQIDYLQDFATWIRKRFEVKEALSIASVLLSVDSDEEKAFDLFFFEFDKFKAEIEEEIL